MLRLDPPALSGARLSKRAQAALKSGVNPAIREAARMIGIVEIENLIADLQAEKPGQPIAALLRRLRESSGWRKITRRPGATAISGAPGLLLSRVSRLTL